MSWIFRYVTEGDTPMYCIGYYDPQGNYVCAGAHTESLLDAIRIVCLLNGGQWENRLNMEMIESPTLIVENPEDGSNEKESRIVPLRIVRNERESSEGDDSAKR